MDAEPYVNRILDDEGLVGDLEGDAAEKLVGWLVKSAGKLAANAKTDAEARAAVANLCQRGREIAAEAAKEPSPISALTEMLAKEAQFQ
jgi:hypothetical protein